MIVSGISEQPVSTARLHVDGMLIYKPAGMPEFETIAALGSLCSNDDLGSVAKANNQCNRLGMDTISAGNIVAFAMECYEKGVIRKEDVPGKELAWGDTESMIELLENIGKREAIGNILAEGVMRAADKIGNGAEECALHVKGLEMPLHDPRVYQGDLYD